MVNRKIHQNQLKKLRFMRSAAAITLQGITNLKTIFGRLPCRKCFLRTTRKSKESTFTAYLLYLSQPKLILIQTHKSVIVNEVYVPYSIYSTRGINLLKILDLVYLKLKRSKSGAILCKLSLKSCYHVSSTPNFNAVPKQLNSLNSYWYYKI